MKKIQKLEAVDVPIADLELHPHNARQGDVGAIMQSLSAHGQFRPIVVQKSRMRVIAGNHTTQAAQLSSMKTISAVLLDVDDDQALRILLADNQTGDQATNDPSILADLLEGLIHSDFGLEGTGFTGDDLDQLIADFDLESIVEVKEDPEPVALPENPVTKVGDVWILGRHRLVCGDSTTSSTTSCLLQGKLADLLFTDPPYGVDYKGISNDHLKGEKFRQFLTTALTLAFENLRPGANCYVWHADIHAYETIGAFRDSGFTQAKPPTIQWVKDSLVLSQGDYHSKSEPCLYGWKPGTNRVRVEDRTQTTIWEYPRPSRAEGHPTMKPIELCKRAITNSSRESDAVLDPFSGSGSTLIACEQTNRTAYLIELDPAYCDVICNRFQGMTEITPILEATGEEVSFVDV